MMSIVFEKHLKFVPRTVSTLIMFAATVLLSIWLFFPEMKEFSAHSMKFNTALLMILSSGALWLLKDEPKEGEELKLSAGHVLAGFILFAGLSSLSQYIFKINLGIDETFVSDLKNSESMLYPGRMSPIASVCFTLVGLGFLFVNKKRGQQSRSAYFLVPVFFISLLSLISYFYNESALYQLGSFTKIPWQSALCFLILSIGILFTRPEQDPILLLTSSGLGGLTSRRLIPLIVLIPVMLGSGWLFLRRNNLVDQEMGVSLFVITMISIFIIIIAYIARMLDKQEAESKFILSMSAAKFKKLADARAEALKARDEFLSIASHELKTPLTSLKLYTQLIQRRMNKDENHLYTKDEVNAMTQQTDKQIARLTRLVDDMLDIGRIRSGRFKLNKEEFDFCDILQEVVTRMHPQFEAARVLLPEIKFCHNSKGQWDKIRLEQVIENLFTNAIRYGEGKLIEVKIETAGNTIHLEVRDHGIGVAFENHTKIFQRFERIPHPSAVNGLGMGLFITKQIITAHGGKIWVESDFGQGSNFIVEMPKYV